MSETPSNEPPTDDPLGATAGEEDLDTVLANAADLAAELSEEVGAATDQGKKPPAGGAAIPPDAGDDNVSIDQQLDDIEKLLDRAADAQKEHEDQDDSESDDGSTLPASDEISYESEDPSASSTDEPPPAGLSGIELSEEDLDALDIAVPDLGEPGDLSLDMEAPPSANGDTPEADGPAGGQRGASRAVWRVAVRVGDKLADVLDLVDRLFGWVTYDLRRLIGYAALVTLLAAGCVLVYSWTV